MIVTASLIVLGIAAWMAAMELSLRNGAKASLLEWLDRSGRSELSTRLETRLDAAADLLALLRSGIVLAFLGIWIGGTVGWDPSGVSAWSGRVLGMAAAAAILMWIAQSVLAPAVARWDGEVLLRGCLPVVRIAATWSPVVHWASRLLTEIVRRLSGAHLHQNGRTGEAEAELLRSIEAKQREGELAEGAATLLENVVDFTTTDVGEVMTPRTEIEGIELTNDLAAIRSFILEAGHSRIPVFQEDLDHIEGILYVKDLIPFLGEDAAGFELQPLLRRPIVVPDTKPVADLLADFQQAEVHMAIVVDEYGGTAGLATIEDVLEEIVGEIYDEHEGEDEDEEPELTSQGDHRWEVDGRYHIDDLNEALEASLPEDDEYDTVGGWFTAQVGHVPEQGASIEFEDLHFSVLEAEPTHVKRLRINRRAS